MIEQVFVVSFLAGLALLIAGAIALAVVAFATRIEWGIGLVLFPPLGLVYILKHPRRSLWPATLMAVGLIAMVGPAVYTRFAHVDLGPHRAVVDGEVRITLTGWDRKDYDALKQEPDAVVVQMANADVDDRVIANLAGMVRLRELDLSNSGVTDEGIGLLARLPRLQTLRLKNTRVSDAGFQAGVAPIESLKQVDVSGTAVTVETLDAWKNAQPGRRGLR